MRPHDATPAWDREVAVPFRHRVWFTDGALDPANPALAHALRCACPGREAPGRMAAFIDSGVLAAWPRLTSDLARYLQTHAGLPELIEAESMPGGEACKNDPSCVEHVLGAVDRLRIDRHSMVLAIGGGAVLDVVGFGAAIAHRGVRHVRMPTTVLAQDDSAMGVKNGVNRKGKKNFTGSFAPPDAVVCDRAFLGTLSDAAWCGGFSEAVKIALLKDAALFNTLERDGAAIRERSMDAAWPVIMRSAELHARHIIDGGDPFETHQARPLDHGHWAAHRLESLTTFELPHGEAVGIGLALDTVYARRIGLLGAEAAARILRVLANLGLARSHPMLASMDDVLGGLEEFREHLGGTLSITLMRDIGHPVEVHEIDRVAMREAASELLAAHG
ncbi:MAG: 3-dehydroquinate synthase [Phycisphaerae bacterium]|nr:3-dehydroquinate synthase [Phycisphaerae bacterium]